MTTTSKSELALQETAPLLDIFADKVRRQIVVALGNSKTGLNVTQITTMVAISRPAVSHHLQLMKQAGIINMQSNGVEHIYYLTLKEPLAKLQSLFETLSNEYDRPRN